jgi:glycosyltransferase involved in cell wall biosynthesis
VKITIVQGAFLPVPALLGGAVEKVWDALGREFVARGHAVTHVSRRHPDLANEETAHGVRHLRVPGFDTPASLLRLKALDFLFSLRVLRRLPPADVLVTNTFWLPILARDASRGQIYVHVARFPKGQMRFYTRAARLHTVSSPVAEAISSEAPRLASRVRVIPYPLNNDAAGPGLAGSEARREKQILFVGRVHPEKGVHVLLQAFASIAPEDRAGWRVVIVGPSEVRLGGGGEAYAAQLRDLAAPIAAQVEWVGSVFDPARLAACYRRAPIFVYPSLADFGETFGLAPLEAMSHGCAPIVSNLACFRDFIHEGVHGLFFDHRHLHPELQLAAQLQLLMRDEPRRLTLATAALSKSQEYGLDRVASLYLEDFRSLLPDPAASMAFA